LTVRRRTIWMAWAALARTGAHALAAALSRVLCGERPDPRPRPGVCTPVHRSGAAALYIDACRHLLASRQTPPPRDSGHPGGKLASSN
jgi:hypothetical protein